MVVEKQTVILLQLLCLTMAKTKTIMDMTPQELLKMFVADVGTLIDARIRTFEINIKAHTDAVIKASEDRVTSELRQEIKAEGETIRRELQTETKQAQQELSKRIDTAETNLTKQIHIVNDILGHKLTRVSERLDNHEKRLEGLEENQVSTHKN